MSTSASVHVALLRGINVAGRRKLPMKELVGLFETAGCDRVRTYIQSGNVVFEAPAGLAEKLPKRIGDAIAERFGFEVPVVTRSAHELGRIVEANPFGGPEDADDKSLHVGFLATRPDPEQVADLDEDRSPPDEFVVDGRQIYLRLPNGMARTKLTNAYFDSRLDTTVTMRNWRTTLKLLEMAQE